MAKYCHKDCWHRLDGESGPSTGTCARIGRKNRAKENHEYAGDLSGAARENTKKAIPHSMPSVDCQINAGQAHTI